MIARLEFDLPEDQHEFQTAVNAEKWRLVAWELDERLRALIKYGENNGTMDVPTIESIRGELHDLLIDQNLSFSD
jgi:hypothetical protein